MSQDPTNSIIMEAVAAGHPLRVVPELQGIYALIHMPTKKFVLNWTTNLNIRQRSIRQSVTQGYANQPPALVELCRGDMDKYLDEVRFVVRDVCPVEEWTRDQVVDRLAQLVRAARWRDPKEAIMCLTTIADLDDAISYRATAATGMNRETALSRMKGAIMGPDGQMTRAEAARYLGQSTYAIRDKMELAVSLGVKFIELDMLRMGKRALERELLLRTVKERVGG